MPSSLVLMRALLALLPCAAVGRGVQRAGGMTVLPAPDSLPKPSSAWVATPPLRQRGGAPRSGCMGCTTGSPADGGGGGAAGNQGTDGKGSSNNRSRSAGGGGIGSMDSGSSSSSGGGGGGGSDHRDNINNIAGGSGEGGGGGQGVGGGRSEGDNRGDLAALERQFSQLAAPRREIISEGLGKGAPSPTQRLRLQQENLDMKWKLAKQGGQTICCRKCAGEGLQECRFCAGSGMFKIGSELMLDPVSGRPPPCPVCRSKGEEQCSRCHGAGRIAAWLFESERRRWEGDRSPPADGS